MNDQDAGMGDPFEWLTATGFLAGCAQAQAPLIGKRICRSKERKSLKSED